MVDMTIDERLERLVGRHEALAQSVELLSIETRELRSAIGELRAAQEKDAENIRTITTAIEMDAENIRALARVAEIHERRLTHLEGE